MKSVSMRRSKKGIAVWVSWVIIIGLSVSLGIFFFNWARDLTTDTTEEIITRTDQNVFCDTLSIRIESSCQNTQTLNMNISNIGDIKLNELQVRLFDIYNEPSTIGKNITLKPGKTRSVEVVKQGAIAQADIIPVTMQDDTRFICQGRKITLENVRFC